MSQSKLTKKEKENLKQDLFNICKSQVKNYKPFDTKRPEYEQELNKNKTEEVMNKVFDLIDGV